MEVFCIRIKPSRNHFRAFVQEEAPRPTPCPAEPEDDLGGYHRSKVEDDLDIGGDLLKISQRRNIEEFDEEIGGRRNESGRPGTASESEFASDLDKQLPVTGTEIPITRTDARNSSWGRRSSNWEISPEIFTKNSSAAGSGSLMTEKEKILGERRE